MPRVGLRAALRGRRSRPRPAKAVNRSLSSILLPGFAGLALARLVDDVCPHSYKRAKDAIEAYLEAYTGSTKDQGIAEKPPIGDRMKILESYVGIVKLKKPFTLEEILELEEDNRMY